MLRCGALALCTDLKGIYCHARYADDNVLFLNSTQPLSQAQDLNKPFT